MLPRHLHWLSRSLVCVFEHNSCHCAWLELIISGVIISSGTNKYRNFIASELQHLISCELVTESLGIRRISSYTKKEQTCVHQVQDDDRTTSYGADTAERSGNYYPRGLRSRRS